MGNNSLEQDALLEHTKPAVSRIPEKISDKIQVKRLEVACAELQSLPPSRAVYLKQGTIYFRSDAKKASIAQQKELEIARASLEKQKNHS